MINELSGRPAGVPVCVCSSNDSSLKKNRFTLIQLSHSLTESRLPCLWTDSVLRPLILLIVWHMNDFFHCSCAADISLCLCMRCVCCLMKNQRIYFQITSFSNFVVFQSVLSFFFFFFLSFGYNNNHATHSADSENIVYFMPQHFFYI